MRRRILSAFLLSLCMFSAQEAARGADRLPDLPANVRTITTRGEAVVNVVPDKFTLVADVTTFDKLLAHGYDVNQKKMTDVLALASKYKIAQDDVQTSEINVSPTYAESSYSGPKGNPVGFYVVRQVSFVLHDPKLIAPMIKDVLDAGANSLQRVSFDTSELRKHKDRARVMALKAAAEKAVLLSAELKSTVGMPVRIEETTPPYARPFSDNASQNVAVSPDAGAEDDENYGGVALGRIPVRAAVLATFQLE